MIRQVLVATDGSEASVAAVRAAVDLTRSLGPDARLHVGSVIDYAEVPVVLSKQPAGAPDLLAEQAQAALKNAAEIVSAGGLEAGSHLLHGEIVEALLSCAAEVRADILVAGFHGQNRLARLVMGSVVGKLVRSTTLPVVVVRAPSDSASAPIDGAR
jgi:nucleotide-binding universal stress UspA family protein